MAAQRVPPVRLPSTGPDQEIRFCSGAGGTRIAYAVHGSGPPLVVVSCWLSHLRYDWQSPVWRHFLDDLGAFATVVRYDERGFGLSDWSVGDFSLEARLGDLEGVVDAAGLGRFAVLGMSGGSAVAIAYAARHPERVSRLVLYGTVSGRPSSYEGERLAEEETYRSMIRVGWAKEDPVFRRVFTGMFIPDASEEQMRWFDALQRMATSADNAVASRVARQAVDVVADLARIAAPTLVLQAVGDRMTGFDNGPFVAARVPAARLVPLESRNHILLADEPAWSVLRREVAAFIEPDRLASPAAPARVEELSPRELDVLRLCADGRTNDEIATSLGLSVRTVERHLSNAYAKLGVSGRAARAAAVADLLRGQAAGPR